MVSVLSLNAQDKMASITPSDINMKSIDTLMLHRLKNKEDVVINHMYGEWNNKTLSQECSIPDSFKIVLKHFAMPTTSKVVTSQYGKRWGRMHKGIDIKVYIGDTIVAAFDGKVRVVKYEANGYGNYVVIRHNNGLETVYGHLSKHLVVENQRVKAGQPIGLGGNTGRSTGSHLHFETRLCGVALNPTLLFNFAAQDVTDDYFMFIKSKMVMVAAQPRKK